MEAESKAEQDENIEGLSALNAWSLVYKRFRRLKEQTERIAGLTERAVFYFAAVILFGGGAVAITWKHLGEVSREDAVTLTLVVGGLSLALGGYVVGRMHAEKPRRVEAREELITLLTNNPGFLQALYRDFGPGSSSWQCVKNLVPKLAAQHEEECEED